MASDGESELSEALSDTDLKNLENEVMDGKKPVKKPVNKPEEKGSSKASPLGKKTPTKEPRATGKGFRAAKGIGAKKNDKATVGKNVADVREKLGFLDEKEWLEWLRGPNFKPFWQSLWVGWLKDHRATSGKRGLGLDEVLDIQEAYKGEYFGIPDTTDWGEGQHLAYFMYVVVGRNKQHDDGVFRNRPLRHKEAEMLIWAVLKIVQHLHAPSQLNKPGGGNALMGNAKQSYPTGYQVGTPRSKKTPKKDGKNTDPSDAATDEERFDFSQPELSQEDVQLAAEINEFMEKTLQEHWEKMIPSYGEERFPQKVSPSFHSNEAYWQLMLARKASQIVEALVDEDNKEPFGEDTEMDVDLSDDEKSDSDDDAPLGGEDDDDDDESVVSDNDNDNVWDDVDGDELSETEDTGLPTQILLEDEDADPTLYDGFTPLAADEVIWGEITDDRKQPANLVHVTPEKLKKYQQELEWLEDDSYQPKDWQKAVDSLLLTTPKPDKDSIMKTRHRYMRANTRLEPWQVLGVAKLIEIREAKRQSGLPLQRGAFLGDVMGLGKTYEATAYMLERYRRQEIIQQHWEQTQVDDPFNSTPPPVHKPMLLVVPSAIITQWSKEIQKITSQLKLVILFGDKRTQRVSNWKNARVVTGALDKNDEIFNRSLESAKTLVLTTYETFRNRHGPPAADAWIQSQRRKMKDRRAFSNVLQGQKPPGWPGDLAGLFSDVVLDEGHFVRNPDSGVSMAVRWADPDFYLIMSATIFFNNIHDFNGYVDLVVPKHSDDEWEGSNLEKLGVTADCDPFSLPLDHPAASLMVTRRTIKRNILTNKVTTVVASVFAKKLLSLLMVRRTLSSVIQINDKKMVIGARIPASHTRVINVAFSRKEQRLYDKLVRPHYRRLIFNLPNGKFAINMKKLRLLTLTTSFLGMEQVEKLLTSSNLPAMLKLFSLKTMCQSLAKTVGSGERVLDTKKWLKSVRSKGKKLKPDLNAIVTLMRGSPKLRALIPLVVHNVLVRDEKQLIWCNFPANQLHIAAVLREIGIHAQIYHAKLDFKEREKLVRSFTHSGGCMVLIISTAVNCFGLNLHGKCNEMHFYDLPMTKALLDQAIGRLRRFGQLLVVIVYMYIVQNSWNIRQVQKSNEKAVAGTICDLNSSVFRMVVQSRDDVEFPGWVIREGRLTRLGEGEEAGPDDITEDQAILQAILQAIHNDLMENVGAAFEDDAV